MSQSPHTPFAPGPSAPQAPSAPPAQLVSTRWLLALVTVSLGGYLLVLNLAGQFIQLFTGMRIEVPYGALLVLQLLFAGAVVLLGFFFAPASLARRSIAGAIVAVVVLFTIILQAVRLSTGLGAASVFIGFTFADAFVMLPLALGAAWLVVRARPGLAYAALALVAIPALVHWALLINGVDSATTQIIMLILGALVAAGIGWGGAIAARVLGGASAAPRPQPQQAPQAYGSPAAQPQYGAPAQAPYAQQPVPTEQNDRPAERGPVI
jgi:hypothetical protein